jgi:hypothetical protein
MPTGRTAPSGCPRVQSLRTDATVLPVLANIGGEGAWLDDQAARARDERLFVALPIFLAAGNRAD